MTVEIVKNGKIVMRSRNLAGIFRYQQKEDIYVKKAWREGYYLNVVFSDSARCRVKFCSREVLDTWIKTRQKSGIFP